MCENNGCKVCNALILAQGPVALIMAKGPYCTQRERVREMERERESEKDGEREREREREKESQELQIRERIERSRTRCGQKRNPRNEGTASLKNVTDMACNSAWDTFRYPCTSQAPSHRIDEVEHRPYMDTSARFSKQQRTNAEPMLLQTPKAWS